MTIRALGFLDTAPFTSIYWVKYREKVENGILRLRDIKDGDADASDLPILKEWKSARALLARVRTSAAALMEGVTPELGKAWIEVVPPLAGTPWDSEHGEYADTHHRTRTCLIGGPGAMSYSGQAAANLLPGIVHLVDHHALCSEVNGGEYVRVHLIVDIKIPDAPDLLV